MSCWLNAMGSTLSEGETVQDCLKSYGNPPKGAGRPAVTT